MLTRRTVIGALGGLAAAPGLGLGARAQAAPAIAADDLMAFFDVLALNHSVGGGRSRPGRVRKWTEPVAVRVRGVAAAAWREAIEGLVADVSALTGVDFGLRAPDDPDGNQITLYYLSRREIRRLYPRGHAVCFTQARGRDGHIHSGVVRIGADFEDCLYHEFMHALGFDNHWSGPRAGVAARSVLAGRFAPERTHGFSDWDRLAIRLLYDRRLEAGMAREPALAAAAAIVPELLSA